MGKSAKAPPPPAIVTTDSLQREAPNPVRTAIAARQAFNRNGGSGTSTFQAPSILFGDNSPVGRPTKVAQTQKRKLIGGRSDKAGSIAL